MTASPDIAALVKRLRRVAEDEDSGYISDIADEAADALEACARDAARYRWLRDGGNSSLHVRAAAQDEGGSWEEWYPVGEMIDKPIDAAIDRARGEP